MEICTVGSVRGEGVGDAMVDLNGHEAGNGGHSQGTPKAHRPLSYSERLPVTQRQSRQIRASLPRVSYTSHSVSPRILVGHHSSSIVRSAARGGRVKVVAEGEAAVGWQGDDVYFVRSIDQAKRAPNRLAS